MAEITKVGLDQAKNMCQVHGAARVVLRKKLHRAQVLGFFGLCRGDGSLWWSSFRGSEIGWLGHEVRLIQPAYVKPFVKHQKNDGEEDRGYLRSGSAPYDAFCCREKRRIPGRSNGLSWCDSGRQKASVCRKG